MIKFLQIFLVVVVMVCLVVFTYIYADGGWNALFAHDAIRMIIEEIITHGLVVLIAGSIGLAIAKKKRSQKSREVVIIGLSVYLIFQWFGLFGLFSAGIALVAKHLIDKRPYDKEASDNDDDVSHN